ncbi:hypothetical protein BDW67DRAFT_108706 [Aspergillus spinulosporus]
MHPPPVLVFACELTSICCLSWSMLVKLQLQEAVASLNDTEATTTCLSIELLPPSSRLSEPNSRPLQAKHRLNQTLLAAYRYLQSLIQLDRQRRDSNHPSGALTRSLPRAAALLCWSLTGWIIGSESLVAAFNILPHMSDTTILFGVALPLVFHSLNGVRHLVWDTGKGLANMQVVRGQRAVADT